MRWDEHGWDQFGPAQATDIRAGIDANNKIVAFDYSAFNHGWTQVVESSAQLAGMPLPAVAPAAMIDTVSSGSAYKIANRRVTSNSVNGYGPFMKGTYLRAPGAPQALFAAEQTIDALAHTANMDPIAFRIQNIDATDVNGNARWIAVLDGQPSVELETEGRRVESREGQHTHRSRGRDRRLRERDAGHRRRDHRRQEDGQDHRQAPLRGPGRGHHC